MRSKSLTSKAPAERVVKDIRRATRRDTRLMMSFAEVNVTKMPFADVTVTKTPFAEVTVTNMPFAEVTAANIPSAEVTAAEIGEAERSVKWPRIIALPITTRITIGIVARRTGGSTFPRHGHADWRVRGVRFRCRVRRRGSGPTCRPCVSRRHCD